MKYRVTLQIKKGVIFLVSNKAKGFAIAKEAIEEILEAIDKRGDSTLCGIFPANAK